MSPDDPMAGKVSFDDVYDRPDPRAFFRALAALDYQIPEHARRLFVHLARLLAAREERPDLTVLDVCCSYGVNAALLNHDVTLADLYARYGAAEVDALSAEQLVAADREFYARHRRPQPLRMVGLDVAEKAVGYARRVGLLDAGSAENLEERDPSADLNGVLADVGLVTVTGGIGYVTGTTFDRILAAVDGPEPPWVAAFTLRWVDMRPIAAVLERHGCTVEVLGGRTFRQRRFADEGEREHALSELRRLGVDPQGVESDGYHHAVFTLARPRREALAVPLEELLAPAR